MKKYFYLSVMILLTFACKKNKDNPPPPVADLPNVTIGTQVWTINNLDVSTYRNGDPIPQVADPAQWATLTTGAWCYYGNDPANNTSYGKLYNWYAVTDARGLAPNGWHIPNDIEWTTLTGYLGGNAVAGGKMKLASTLWQAPNTAASNSSGFLGLPGAYRNDAGNSLFLGLAANWWSKTEASSADAWACNLTNSSAVATRFSFSKKAGFSVRCVKD